MSTDSFAPSVESAPPADFHEIGDPMEGSTRFVMGLSLDASDSMNQHGKRDQLVSTVNGWFKSGGTLEDLAESADIAAVSFGGRGIETIPLGPPAILPGMEGDTPFTRVKEANLQSLTCTGNTPMGAGLERIIELVRARRRAVVEDANLTTYRPTVVAVGDGMPNDDWERVIPLIRELEAENRLLVYCVGVTGADFDTLRRIAPDATYESDISFERLAVLLSASAASGASSASAKTVYDTVAQALSGLGVSRRGG